jgi:hypothetical protein
MDRWDEVMDNIVEEASQAAGQKKKNYYSTKSERWNFLEEQPAGGNDASAGNRRYNKNSSDMWDVPENKSVSEKPAGSNHSVASSPNSGTDNSIFNMPPSAVQGPASQSAGNGQGGNLQQFLTFRNFGLVIKLLVMAVVLITASFALIAFFTSPAGQLASIIIVVIVFFVMKSKGMLPF